jgi:hypothetical protein
VSIPEFTDLYSTYHLFQLVKHLPKKLPISTFHDKATSGRAMMENMVFPPFQQVKEEMVKRMLHR